MKKNGITFFSLLIFLVYLLIACSNTKIKYTENKGIFEKSKSNPIINEYKNMSANSFFSSADFDLTAGKVTWQIVNPDGETVYEGYVVNENGKVYRQLTFSMKSISMNIENMNKKEEVGEKPIFKMLLLD